MFPENITEYLTCLNLTKLQLYNFHWHCATFMLRNDHIQYGILGVTSN